MKKLVNLIKNGTEYQVGAVNEEEFSALTGRVEAIESLLDGWDKDLYEVVAELPTENILTSKIYVTPAKDSKGETDNIKEEWAYINDKWELIGKATGVIETHEFMTKALYDALETKNPTTIYAIYKEVTTE